MGVKGSDMMRQRKKEKHKAISISTHEFSAFSIQQEETMAASGMAYPDSQESVMTWASIFDCEIQQTTLSFPKIAC